VLRDSASTKAAFKVPLVDQETSMDRLKISARLGILIGLFAVLLLLAGGSGLYAAAQSNRSLHTVYADRTVCLAQLGEIERLMLANEVELLDAVATAADTFAHDAPAHAAAVRENIARITQVWDAYSATYLTPEEAKLASAFAEQRSAFVQQGLRPTLQALDAADHAGAARLAIEKLAPLFEPAAHTLHALVQLQVDVAKTENDEAVARYAAMRALSIAGITGGLVLGIAFGTWMVRSIARQLGGEPHEVLKITQAIAAGDLATPVHVPRKAPHSVMAGMVQMQQALQGIVHTVRGSSESIAAGTTQIALGNADLSQRTEEQASNLQQTAASMEQLSETVKANAETAQQAVEMATAAHGVAAKGGEVVAQVVRTMDEINTSSRKIADITGVIDSIAFQTNILALNAAVEAARAGEQGRGFAVVAGEVRALAQRAAQAAKEIKGLVEASVDRVQAGTGLVNDAGRTMDEIVAQVRRVSDLIGEIGAASHEQTSGIGQVSHAVSQLDQVTQQNAALVEESAAASESLKQQAGKLVDAVAVFRLAPA
jgi:methyl-accepting chemotaxis protein-1 (serine sensor receptor)